MSKPEVVMDNEYGTVLKLDDDQTFEDAVFNLAKLRGGKIACAFCKKQITKGEKCCAEREKFLRADNVQSNDGGDKGD